ncbi:MAG: response regulator transcription factor [Lachnospiraceae bacterium]|nr:response regulator transcription factor [Lachnospiraceae bacterium]
MDKILIVEDDNNINQMIYETFSREGYNCTSAFSGTEALLHIGSGQFDLIILDLMLPGLPGDEVLKNIRKDSNVPVIVLSAKDELDTKVDLLTLGANDYMVKPFELKELKARVLVQLRDNKKDVKDNGIIEFNNLKYDLQKKQISVGGKNIPFTVHELRIIELLLRHPGQVFSKNEIYEYAWDDYYIGEDKTINVHISNIRQKIKKVTDTEYIETVWGLGFKLATE